MAGVSFDAALNASFYEYFDSSFNGDAAASVAKVSFDVGLDVSFDE